MEREKWNLFISDLPGTHVLQTWEWGHIKESFGWKSFHKVWADNQGKIIGAALILTRELVVKGISTGTRVMYVPKGPLLDWNDENGVHTVLCDLEKLAKEQKTIFIKIDPDVMIGVGMQNNQDSSSDPTGEQVRIVLESRGWKFSSEQIQFQNTFMIDLTRDEENLLAQMKQKTRYNIRLAQRKGVTTRMGGVPDLPLLSSMYTETAARDGFVIRDIDYYIQVWREFINAGIATPIIAQVEEIPVAAVMLFGFAKKAWYLYGMSRDLHREKMPNYLLQWESMRYAKALGCTAYDLWGAPDVFDESDRLWGVYRFKQGLGGEIVRYIGAWDYTERPALYSVYTITIPKILSVMRKWRIRTLRRQLAPEESALA